MEFKRRSLFVYGVLAVLWVVVAAWQLNEHVRVRDAARESFRNRSLDIANTVSAFLRGLRFRGTVLQERLEPVLQEMVSGGSDELRGPGEVLSIVLLNAANEPVAAAGAPIDLAQNEALERGERWGQRSVTLVNPIDLGAVSDGGTNPILVLPPFQQMTNTAREPERSNRGDRRSGTGPGPNPEFGPRPGEPPPGPPPEFGGPGSRPRPGTNSPPSERRGEWDGRNRRPPWFRNISEAEYQSFIQKRTLHGLVIAMSTDPLRSAITQDLWLRSLIMLLASVSVLGLGLAWRTVVKSSELQIRLVRASELNTHLKEMNVAAAGLAHETRNPLNIIRGLAHMVSRRTEAGPEIQEHSRAIINEADKVAAQLNEFINYSRPREVRRAVVSLNAVTTEVVRALNFDLEEKRILLQVKGEPLSIEADEQMLRQALFNLLLNATQAVVESGEIHVVFRKTEAQVAMLEIRDNGPGVPPENRKEIFRPYFTTHQKGTGLGLAVVQQIVLAHGWEIECLPNEPRGAVFRITHLKVAGT